MLYHYGTWTDYGCERVYEKEYLDKITYSSKIQDLSDRLRPDAWFRPYRGKPFTVDSKYTKFKPKPEHSGPIINSIQFVVFDRFYQATKYFLYHEKQQKWYVFDTKDVRPAILWSNFIPEKLPNNLTIGMIQKHLPEVKQRLANLRDDEDASNLNFLNLDIDLLKLDHYWMDLLNK